MRRMRLLFVTTAIVFGIQFAFYQTVREPYPALILPAFPGQPVVESTLSYDDPVARIWFRDGGEETVGWRRLIPPAPIAMEAIFAATFRDAESDPATSDWLGRRVAALFPERLPTGAELIWRRANYNVDDSSIHFDEISSLYLDLRSSAR